MMQVHPRATVLESAVAEFGLFWAKYQRAQKIDSYEQGFRIINFLEKFWLDTSLEGLTPFEASQKWLEMVEIQEVAGEAVGNELAYQVRDCALTYGEVYSILTDVRATSLKYFIRAERHPDDPDKPGGLA
jgi:hypothetical protein